MLSAARRGRVQVTLGAENPLSITLAVDAKRGNFRGTFRLPDSRKKVPFSGVFFQKRNKAAGFYRAPGGVTGDVELSPVTAAAP